MTDPLCMSLYRQMLTRGIISEESLWDKIRLIAGERRLAATKRLLAAFPAESDIPPCVKRCGGLLLIYAANIRCPPVSTVSW